MDDIKKIEGKIVKTIQVNNDGKNSYMIMAFEDGGKVNIISSVNGDQGVGQLDINMNENELESLIGKRIWMIEEEFDGENDVLKILFRDKTKMEIAAFCTSEDSTASLEYTIYADSNIVKESIDVDNDTASDWQKIHLLVFERTESGDIQDERELQLVINTLIGLKKRGVYKNIDDEDIKDAAWEGFTDAKYGVNENAYPKRGQYPLSQMQYENTVKDNIRKAKRLEQWSEAAEIFADLEEWLTKHNIADQDEELEEIESWLDINLEGTNEIVTDRVLELVRNKYDIE